MNIGVTGGAGYIGSFLVKKIIEKGNSVFSVDNERFGDYSHLEKLGLDGLTLVKGDIRDKDLLMDTWSECDVLVHLAALSDLDVCNEQPEEAVSTNIYGTHQVMEAVKNLGIDKVVFCSSAAVYGTPKSIPITEENSLDAMNLYGVTKIAGEKILNSYWINDGINTLNLRFGNIYGVGIITGWHAVIPKFVKQALSGEDITIYGDGEATRDYIHIQDITKVIIDLIEKDDIGGETFNLGGETLSVNQVADMVVEETEKMANIHPRVINTAPRLGETKEFSYDLSKIRSMVGLDNEWTVRMGIRQLIEYRMRM